jgi:hypothetical protein
MMAETFIGFLLSILAEKIINDSLPKLDVTKIVPNRSYRFNERKEQYNLLKICLLLPISRLYLMPNFDIEEPTLNKVLLNSYFDVVITLLDKIDLGDESKFKYHASNFLAPSVHNKDQLLGYLKREKEYPTQNTARYLLGFRSISVLLEDNLDKIDVNYILNINSKLQPFFSSFKNKDLLIPGLSIN